jgi:DinB superfamily
VIVVHPPLDMGLDAADAETLAAEGLFADDAVGLVAALQRVTDLWDEAVKRARTLDPALLDERVDGEWSFLETMRHLIFATDAWVDGILLGQPSDFHPLGMPPAHAGDVAGLTIDARPTLDEVVIVRAERQRANAAAFEAAAEGDLSRPCAGVSQYTMAAALQVIVYEEAYHLRYATRDLDRLTGTADSLH